MISILILIFKIQILKFVKSETQISKLIQFIFYLFFIPAVFFTIFNIKNLFIQKIVRIFVPSLKK